MKRVKATQPAPQPKTSAKRLEKRRRQVASRAAPRADSRPRPVVRALRNFDRQLKLVSVFHSLVATLTGPVPAWPRHQAQPKLPLPQLDLPAQVFCSPDRQLLIPSRARSAIAPCLCFCRAMSSWSMPWHLRPVHPSTSSRGFRRAFFRNYRRVAPDQSRQQQSRRKEQTKARRRPRSKMAPAIELVRD